MLALVGSTAHALYYTAWVSEEGGGPATFCSAWNEAARGFGCSGSYCDSVRLVCDTLPNSISEDPSSDYWSPWFSEEWNGLETRYSVGWWPHDQMNYKVCEPTAAGGVMSGVKCFGSYCDSMSIECDVPHRPNGTVVTPTGCFWSGTFSDENGTIDMQAQYGTANLFISGVWCSGRYCDNLSYLVCHIS
jgi:hypothetical protein